MLFVLKMDELRYDPDNCCFGSQVVWLGRQEWVYKFRQVLIDAERVFRNAVDLTEVSLLGFEGATNDQLF